MNRAVRKMIAGNPAFLLGFDLELFYPNLIDRHTYQTWLDLGMPTMYTKAREKVVEILASPLADPLPESISRELDEILLSADKELAG